MLPLTVIFAVLGGILGLVCLIIAAIVVIKDRDAKQWGLVPGSRFRNMGDHAVVVSP